MGIPPRRMPNFIYMYGIFPDPLSLLECSVCQVIVFPTSLSSPKFTDIVKFHDKSNNCVAKMYIIPGGGGFVFQAGYHPHKRTFKTHPKHVFFRYENRPLEIQIFACVFLNLSVMSFPKIDMTKNTPFFPNLHVSAPLNDVRGKQP